MQDDLLHESLTVTEVLYYAAMLRLPQAMTKQQKVERVETVIKALGLVKCKDTIVGEVPPGCFRVAATARQVLSLLHAINIGEFMRVCGPQHNHGVFMRLTAVILCARIALLPHVQLTYSMMSY